MGDHLPGSGRPPRSYLKLRDLHRAMLAKGLTRVIFTGSNYGSTVETLFCADDDPMVLCVAVTHGTHVEPSKPPAGTDATNPARSTPGNPGQHPVGRGP